LQNHNPNELDKQLEEQLNQQAKERGQALFKFFCFFRSRSKGLENHPFKSIDKRIYPSIINMTIHLEQPLNELLKFTAYGQPEKVLAILKENLRLLLERGDAIDPAGNLIPGVTAYELALGAGDNEMATMIRGLFDQFEGGENARIEQEKNYQDAINHMLESPKQAFNFNELLQIIVDAPEQDVTEELKTDDFNVNYEGRIHPQYKKTLRQALEEFRKYFSPRVIKHGEMHFNYANLQTAFDLYNKQYNKLKETSNGNWDKQDLFLRQVIGFIQRGLPACDRQAFARDLHCLVEEKKPKPLERCFDFKYSDGSFPITAGDLSRSGLGYKYAADACWIMRDVAYGCDRVYKTYVEQKHQTCRTYTATPTKESSVCNFKN